MTPSLSNRFRSGPSMELDFEGIQGANRLLLDAAARAEDMRVPLEQVKGLLIEGHRRNFESHGAFFGESWPENSPETIARKGREGVRTLSALMVDEGDLQEALSGGKGGRSLVTKGAVSVGVTLIQALFAQGGASGARRGVEPARPVIGITEGEREESLRLLTAFLVGRP